MSPGCAGVAVTVSSAMILGDKIRLGTCKLKRCYSDIAISIQAKRYILNREHGQTENSERNKRVEQGVNIVSQYEHEYNDTRNSVM